jgi:hypothetical protein
MSSLSSFFVAVLTGALGFAATMVVATAFNDWFRLSNGSDIGAAWLMVIIGAAGGLVFFVLGLVVSNVVAPEPEPVFFRALGISCGTVFAIGGVALLVGWLRADLPPKIDGQAIALAVEVRAPAEFSLPKVASESDAVAGVRAASGRVRSFGHLDLKRAKKVDGQWTITATVTLGTSSKQKVLEVSVGQETSLTFQLPLRAHPSRNDTEEWSPWIVADPAAGQPESSPEKKFHLRYRVRFDARITSERAAEEQAKFDAFGADTPIQAWIDYIRQGDIAARIPPAMKRITARPNCAAELAALMVGEQDDYAAAALQLVAYFPPPQPALLAPVAAAGRDLAQRIRAVNANAQADDPHPSGGHSASLRFTAWMEAVRALREKSGGDFIPELGEILVLARVRPQTALLQDSVRGVASQALKQWANVEPLPGDLPAR